MKAGEYSRRKSFCILLYVKAFATPNICSIASENFNLLFCGPYNNRQVHSSKNIQIRSQFFAFLLEKA